MYFFVLLGPISFWPYKFNTCLKRTSQLLVCGSRDSSFQFVITKTMFSWTRPGCNFLTIFILRRSLYIDQWSHKHRQTEKMKMKMDPNHKTFCSQAQSWQQNVFHWHLIAEDNSFKTFLILAEMWWSRGKSLCFWSQSNVKILEGKQWTWQLEFS